MKLFRPTPITFTYNLLLCPLSSTYVEPPSSTSSTRPCPRRGWLCTRQTPATLCWPSPRLGRDSVSAYRAPGAECALGALLLTEQSSAVYRRTEYWPRLRASRTAFLSVTGRRGLHVWRGRFLFVTGRGCHVRRRRTLTRFLSVTGLGLHMRGGGR